MEGSASLADLSRLTIDGLGLSHYASVEHGRFSDLLSKVAGTAGPFDIVFIDGHHDEHATIEYFDALRGATASDAIIIFDDIRWTAGMRRAWSRVKVDDRVAVSLDLGSMGICLLGEPEADQVHLSAPLRGM